MDVNDTSSIEIRIPLGFSPQGFESDKVWVIDGENPMGTEVALPSISNNVMNVTIQGAPVVIKLKKIGDNGIPPEEPTDLQGTSDTSSTVQLNWTDNADNETNYLVERALGETMTYEIIATLESNASSYTDIGLTPNTIYKYRVKAINQFGDSFYSNLVNVTTLEDFENVMWD